MLWQRVVTAVVLLALLLPTIFIFGPVSWGLLTLVFLAVAGWEWRRLLADEQAPLASWIVAATLVVLGLIWMFVLPGATDWVQQLAPWLFGLAALYWLLIAPWRLRAHGARAGGTPVIVILLFACWAALYTLRQYGPTVLIVALAIVWVADIGAYFIGRGFGRRKLAPQISPGKSWEGAIGGAFLVAVIGLFAAAAPGLEAALPARLVSHWSHWVGVLILAALAALSVIGDLHESLLKREAGVKDSGVALPGHGGVLDRIDALVPVMPVAALLHWVLR